MFVRPAYTVLYILVPSVGVLDRYWTHWVSLKNPNVTVAIVADEQ